MNKNLVSICIPSYNNAKYIRKAIKSVQNQNYHNIEIIIVDNASEDNTEDIVKCLIKDDNRIKYIKNNKNIGYPKNFNKSMKFASGRYITFLCSDDFWIDDENYLTKAVSLLDNDNSVKVYYSGYHGVKVENGRYYFNYKKTYLKKGKFNGYDIVNDFLRKQQAPGWAWIFRKNSLEKVKGFDEDLVMAPDSLFFLKLCLEENVYISGKYIYAFCNHGENLGYSVMKKNVIWPELVEFENRLYNYIYKKDVNKYNQLLKFKYKYSLVHTMSWMFSVKMQGWKINAFKFIKNNLRIILKKIDKRILYLMIKIITPVRIIKLSRKIRHNQ